MTSLLIALFCFGLVVLWHVFILKHHDERIASHTRRIHDQYQQIAKCRDELKQLGEGIDSKLFDLRHRTNEWARSHNDLECAHKALRTRVGELTGETLAEVCADFKDARGTADAFRGLAMAFRRLQSGVKGFEDGLMAAHNKVVDRINGLKNEHDALAEKHNDLAEGVVGTMEGIKEALTAVQSVSEPVLAVRPETMAGMEPAFFRRPQREGD